MLKSRLGFGLFWRIAGGKGVSPTQIAFLWKKELK